MEDEDLQTRHPEGGAAPFVMPEVSLENLGKPIDAVIAWVNGADPAHISKRESYLDTKIARHAKSGHRFLDADEIRFCLRSIRNHAPWIRKIWLLTDDQFPASIDRKFAESEGIHAVDHRTIFAGYEDYLPTFNSLAIETFMWRIPGLSDRFLYFNDDMFLAAPVKPKHFFTKTKAILRGKWKSAEAIKPIPWNVQNQIVSAQRTGFEPTRFWASAHVAHAVYRPVMEALFNANREVFEENARHRFRKRSQWWSIAVHDNWLLKNSRAKTKSASDVAHFSVGLCRTGETALAQKRLTRVANHGAKLMCVNDLGALSEKVPDALNYIATATGPARDFEAVPLNALEEEATQLQAALIAAAKRQPLASSRIKSRREQAEKKAAQLEKVVTGLRSEVTKVRSHPLRYALSRVFRRLRAT